MSQALLRRRPEDFLWATGIENTFVPQTRPGHRALDEYQLMGHYEHWRDDLALVRDLGLRMIRWGVPWYRIEPFHPGDYDWRWTDQVIPYMVEELGITPIIDLMHYGCPFWLRREFASPEYPAAVSRYAEAFARRYERLVQWYTPLNEPIVTALYCGQRGLWPPYLRSETGYVQILLQAIEGIIETSAALRSVNPEMRLVHVEATGLSRTAREDLHAVAQEEQSRTFLPFDLLTGQVTPSHPLFTWLVRSGASPDRLAAIAERPVPFTLMGLNFYPQWSTTQLYINRKGRLAYQAVEEDGAGFSSLIEGYYKRYQIPIMVTETSARGDEAVRGRWLEASVAAIRGLRSHGVPVLGYTWFPLFTMIDWRYRFGRAPLQEYRLELGLYSLNGHEQRWKPTPLVEQFRSYVSDAENSVGNLGVEQSSNPPTI
jgi:beta-glucosidase/6-phospho-beta-glucosidase/beta-galactosidase